jgi:hypothetical protein
MVRESAALCIEDQQATQNDSPGLRNTVHFAACLFVMLNIADRQLALPVRAARWRRGPGCIKSGRFRTAQKNRSREARLTGFDLNFLFSLLRFGTLRQRYRQHTFPKAGVDLIRIDTLRYLKRTLE